MMRGSAVVVILGIVAVCCARESAATQERAAEVFSKAVRYYQSGVYDSTIVIIRDFLSEHGKAPEAEYQVPLIMEALVRKGDFTYVHRLFDLYSKKFSASAYMPRLFYLHGVTQAHERLYADAFTSFSRALELGVSADLDSLVMKNVETICANALDGATLHTMGGERSNHSSIREIARYYEIRKILSTGEIGRAKTCFADFKNDFPHSRFEPQMGDLNAPQSKKQLSIGLLAPLSGDDADVGRRVTQGFRLAIDKYNGAHATQIVIVSCDTRGMLIETVRKTAQLMEYDRVPLVVGPMLSQTATAAAGMLRNKETVMFTPTATDDGIADLGANIFQMNITLGVLARKLARYAINNLNIREFATVAPRTAYGASMAALFKDEVVKNGGTVFDEESFEEGGNDFTAQFVNLRRKLLVRRLDQAARVASADSYKPVTVLTPADSARWADSTVSIGAVFLPAETDDVVMLAPQVAFNRIKAQLLGSNGWHSAKTVAEGKQYVQNAIISTPFEPDSAWKKWPDFRKEYTARFREEPDRVAALGFDAGTIAAAALENTGGVLNAQRIAESIAGTQKFEGTSGVISIDRTTRTNSEAIIFKVTANGFVRVQ
jgi:ABC-type branched-subunit amino acid transport system substrate-binding protein